MKTLSISIAAYNVQSTLDLCLSRLASCKNLDFIDVMIINDGSTDDTAKIASKYAKRYPESMRVISKKNGGWGSTVNTGIVSAKGTYFKQLDGDDYYDPGNLDRFVEYLNNCDSDLVVSPFCHFDDRNGAITKIFGRNDDLVGTMGARIEEVTDLYPPAMHSLTVKTEVLRRGKVRLLEKCFYTDVEFVLRSLNNSKTISAFQLPIYYYRLGRDGQSMSISGIQKHYKDHERMLFTMIRYINEESSSKTMYDIMMRRIADVVMYQYKFFMAITKNSQHKKELRDFDDKLKKLSKECYSKNYGAPVKLLRKSNFNGYWLISTIKNHQDKKAEVFLYEK